MQKQGKCELLWTLASRLSAQVVFRITSLVQVFANRLLFFFKECDTI